MNTDLSRWLRVSLLAGLVSAGLLSLAPSAQAAVLTPITESLLYAMDGTSVTTSGGASAVVSWNDQATSAGQGGSQNFTDQNTASRRPTLTTVLMPTKTYHPVLDFNGTTNRLMLGSTSQLNTNTASWFLVARPETISKVGFLFSNNFSGGAGANSNNLWNVFTSYLNGDSDGDGGGGSILANMRQANGAGLTATMEEADGSVYDTVGEWILLSGVWNGTAAGDPYTIRLLGSSGLQSEITLTGSNASPIGHVATSLGARTYDPDFVFPNGSTGTYFDGALAEYLVYTTALSAAERDAVESYLYQKYLLPVPEPSSLALWLLLATAGVLHWRRRSAK